MAIVSKLSRHRGEARWIEAFVSAMSPASIRVYSGGAPRVALTQCAAAFEKARGHKIDLVFDGVSGIRDRLRSDERADVVLLPIQMMEALYSSLLRLDSRVVLARSPLGVAVRRDAALPNVSSPEAFRAAVLGLRAASSSAACSSSFRWRTRSARRPSCGRRSTVAWSSSQEERQSSVCTS